MKSTPGIPSAKGDLAKAKSVANGSSKPQADPTKVGSDWNQHPVTDSGPGSNKR